MRIFLLCIAVVALISGVKFIYDARPIVKRYFGIGDKNEASLALKIAGFILTAIGVVIIYFVY